MDFVNFPKISRYSRNVIITEKLDGTNASIFIGENGEFLTGSRTRWITPDDDNAGFSRWAHEHKEELMELGPGHHFGEWWGQGIQRKYGMNRKVFSLFNTHRWIDFRPVCCDVVPVLAICTMDTLNVADIMEKLRRDGSLASPGFMFPEGIVIFHTGANMMFKKTFEKDGTGKWDKSGVSI